MTITFSLDGTVVGTAVTSATGVASLPNVSLVLGGIPITAGAHSHRRKLCRDSQFQNSTGTSTLTVNKALLTVTAQNASKTYGDANPAFTYVISGFLNNETVAVVSGTANCTTSANAEPAQELSNHLRSGYAFGDKLFIHVCSGHAHH